MMRKAPPAGGVQTHVPEEEAPGGGATPATSASMKAAIGGMSPSKDRRSSIAMLDAVMDERPDGGCPINQGVVVGHDNGPPPLGPKSDGHRFQRPTEIRIVIVAGIGGNPHTARSDFG